MFFRAFMFLILSVATLNGSSCFSHSNGKENINIPPIYKECKIRILTNSNGVGLSRDLNIIWHELNQLGHKLEYVNCYDLKPVPKVDINIHLELVKPFFFEFAEKNYLIPNPEWYVYDLALIPKFDLILCKTREAERIFKPFNPNTIFIGFTSIDRLIPNSDKDMKSPIHLAGRSIHKSTKLVGETWAKHPEWPSLLLIEHGKNFQIPNVPNIRLVNSYLNENVLIAIQNKHGLHICPSETEGWGHYIMEAMSCEAVVVTTDAPPMNEFILDKRCLVAYDRSEPYRLATNYYPDPKSLVKVIDSLLALPEAELREIGKKNRIKFLENDRIFKENIAEVFKIRNEGSASMPSK